MEVTMATGLKKKELGGIERHFGNTDSNIYLHKSDKM